MQEKPTNGLNQDLGKNHIQGLAGKRSIIPDSPLSAGLLLADQKI